MHNEYIPPAPAEARGCVDPESGALVFDYVNLMLREDEALVFEAHMLRCDSCFQATAALDWMNETLRDKLRVADVQAERGVPAFYFALGGLSVLGLVTLGFIGFTKLPRVKQWLSARREAAPS